MDKYNLLLDTDSYKVSHWAQYPKGMTEAFLYMEARKGGEHGATIFFGLQYLLNKYLSQRITQGDVTEAANIYAEHGVPFNESGWRELVSRYNGFLPVEIKAIREGTLVPEGNVLLTVKTTDPEFPWVAGWLETMLMRLWYPTTVATRSYFMRKALKTALDMSSDDLSGLDFMLHDFGARGVSSLESASIGGAAHLLSFNGTDTVAALTFARDYYHAYELSGFSIPAAEHSTVTAWGPNHEADFFEHMLDTFPTGIVAVVSDTYDLWKAVEVWGSERFRTKILKREGRLVIRPDSGDPLEVVPELLKRLGALFGTTSNSKGYKVLPPTLRVIQGDWMNPDTSLRLYAKIMGNGFSAENLAIGMGGALLQQVNRDTQRFAIKLSHAVIDGVPTSVRKTTATDPTKASKAGLLDLIRNNKGEYQTIDRGDVVEGSWKEPSELYRYYKDGIISMAQSFASIRNRVRAKTNG